MSTTDQSFIRAYTRDTEDNGMNKSPNSTAEAAPLYEEGTTRVVVSQPPISQSVVVADTYVSLPEPEATAGQDALVPDTPGTRAPVREIPASKPSVQHFRPDQSERSSDEPATGTRKFRVDASDTVMPPAPHVHNFHKMSTAAPVRALSPPARRPGSRVTQLLLGAWAAAGRMPGFE